MKSFLVKVLFIIAITSIALTQNISNYERENLNNWACNEGRRQSPIDLMTNNSTFSLNYSIVYENYKSFDDVVLTFQNPLLEISDKLNLLNNSKDKGYVVLTLNGFLHKYDLEKIVINTPSEHFINGLENDLEMSFIHRKDLDYNSEVNSFKPNTDINQYLIISFLYSVNGTYSDSGFIDSVRNHYHALGVTENTVGMKLDVFNSGLIKDKRFFLYSGSETVAPCSETHLHYVVADIYKISQESVNFYKNRYQFKYNNELNGDFNNYRKSISPLNGRPVYRNFYANETEFDNSNSYIKTSIMVLILILLVL